MEFVITLIILLCFYFLLGVSVLYRIQSLLHKDIYLQQYNDLFEVVKGYTQLEIIILWPIILYNYYNNAVQFK